MLAQDAAVQKVGAVQEASHDKGFASNACMENPTATKAFRCTRCMLLAAGDHLTKNMMW
tara:strand:+ start:166 stop:342 length:177 start_codon:yes stop_codon:yes gene_type:complete